jgi:hypothetical protein
LGGYHAVEVLLGVQVLRIPDKPGDSEGAAEQ